MGSEPLVPAPRVGGRREVMALVACHNRRALTLRALESLFRQEVPDDVRLHAVVVDDGSSDGTAEAIRERWPDVRLVCGDGSLFWAGGMARAEQEAMRLGADYVLWLNDDVELAPTAVALLLDSSRACAEAAVVAGAVVDPVTGQLTYSGVRRAGLHPMRFSIVEPSLRLLDVDAFNGNVVLVPRLIYAMLGGIDRGFRHATADFDYALRARKAGYRTVLAPGIVGRCSRDGHRLSWHDRSLAPRERIRLLLSVTGSPPHLLARFLRRHGGPTWPLWWAATYVKFAVSLIYGRFGPGTS